MKQSLRFIAEAESNGRRGAHGRTTDALIRRGLIRFERVSERSFFVMFYATDAGKEALS